MLIGTSDPRQQRAATAWATFVEAVANDLASKESQGCVMTPCNPPVRNSVLRLASPRGERYVREMVLLI